MDYEDMEKIYGNHHSCTAIFIPHNPAALGVRERWEIEGCHGESMKSNQVEVVADEIWSGYHLTRGSPVRTDIGVSEVYQGAHW